MGKNTERTNAHQDVTLETLTASRHLRGGGYFVRPFLPADVVTCAETPVLLTT